MHEEEIDRNEVSEEFELIFKGNQAILCISSEFNEDPMLYGVYIIAGRIYSKQRLIMNASFSELQQIAEDLENLLASMRLIIIITPAIKYPHYNYAIYGNDYLDHWQWFPLTYVYANEYNNFISKLARQLISREKINKLLPVFNFDSVESFIKKCELVEKGI